MSDRTIPAQLVNERKAREDREFLEAMATPATAKPIRSGEPAKEIFGGVQISTQ